MTQGLVRWTRMRREPDVAGAPWTGRRIGVAVRDLRRPRCAKRSTRCATRSSLCSSIRADDGTITGFRIVFANRAASAFMGRMPDMLTGAPGPDTMPSMGVMPFFDAFRHVVETGETWAADARRVRRFPPPAAASGGA